MHAAEAVKGRPIGYLFTDIDGSTEKWERSAEEMARAQARHDQIVGAIVAKNGGYVQDHAGDGVFAIFRAGNPVQCALELQRALQAQDWQSVGGLEVRVGVHCGAPGNEELDQVSVNRAARITASGWGGQIVISAAAA